MQIGAAVSDPPGMSGSFPAAFDSAPHIQLVVKISKYCNLRCTYCYEFNELSAKARMPLEDVGQMFHHVEDAIRAKLIGGVEFVWHGGEPFLIPLEYYRKIAALQRAAFADPDTYHNVVQTNLTVLTDRHIEFLKSAEFFQSLGVSYDVFGDHRVDTKGQLRNEVIIANMEKLIENDISFGAISVLTRSTIPYARQIQRFWEALGKEFRFLPFYLSVGEAQSETHGLTGEQQVAVMKQCFLDWLASTNPVGINPVSEYLIYALEYMRGGAKHIYDPAHNEIVYVVNVDGNLFGIGRSELYRDDFGYGNIFRSSFVDILASANRTKACTDALARMRQHCSACPYFGYCPGHPVADASREDLTIIESYGCIVRHVVDFIVETLGGSEIAAELSARLKGNSPGIADGTSISVRL